MSEQYFRRIEIIQISCSEALRAITDRDTPETVFYLDPRYPGANQKHNSGYTFKHFAELLDLLTQIKGKFILSNYWSQTLRNYVEKNGWHKMSIPVR